MFVRVAKVELFLGRNYSYKKLMNDTTLSLTSICSLSEYLDKNSVQKLTSKSHNLSHKKLDRWSILYKVLVSHFTCTEKTTVALSGRSSPHQKVTLFAQRKVWRELCRAESGARQGTAPREQSAAQRRQQLNSSETVTTRWRAGRGVTSCG